MRLLVAGLLFVLTARAPAHADVELAISPVAYEDTLAFKIDACERLQSSLPAVAHLLDTDLTEDPAIADATARALDLAARKKAISDRILNVSKFCLGTAATTPPPDDWRLIQGLVSRRGNTKFSLTGSKTWSQLETSASGGAGASWSSSLVEGVSAFLIQRARAELVAAFLVTLKTTLCDAAGNGKTLMPSTCEAMASFSAKAFPQAGTALRAALRADIPQLVKRLVQQSCGVTVLVEVALELNDGLERGHAPFEALAALATMTNAACAAHPEFQAALKAIGTGVGLLMKGREILPVLNDLWKDEWVKRVSGVLCPAAPGAPACTITVTKQQLERLHLLLLRLDDLRKQVIEKSDLGKFNMYASGAVDVLALAAAWVPSHAGKLAAVRTVLALASSIRDSVRARDYATAVISTLALLRELKIVAPEIDLTLPTSVTTHVPLLVELTAAENPEAVSRAIEAAALPVGSWSNKRVKGATTVSVNAYLGGRAGIEVLGRGETNLDMTPALEGGLFAPVGIEVSRGFGGYSLGVFVSIVDVGALVSYRLTAPKLDGDPNVMAATADTSPSYTLEQVFSPGLHLALGISDSYPISLGAGFMLTPDLRTIEYSLVGGSPDATRSDRLPSFRVGAFLSIDLPVIAF